MSPLYVAPVLSYRADKVVQVHMHIQALQVDKELDSWCGSLQGSDEKKPNFMKHFISFRSTGIINIRFQICFIQNADFTIIFVFLLL